MTDDISTLGYLERWATETPDRIFLEEAKDGGRVSLSFSSLLRSGLKWTQALRGLGISPGDVVVTMLPTSVEAVEAWVGIAWLRAIDAGIHKEYRGELLRKLLSTANPTAIIVCDSLVERIEPLLPALGNVRVVITMGDRRVTTPSGCAALLASELLETATPAEDLRAPKRHDIACIVFTSGTTGPSKAVVVPWGNYLGTMPVWADLTSDDCFYSPMALCHSAGRSPFTWIGVPGGRWVIRDGFKTDRFWEDIIEFGCTTTQLIPAMTNWLLARSESGEDCGPLRNVVTAPLTERVVRFQERFGINVRTVYGMSEIGMVISRSPRIGSEWRSCGRPTPGFEVRVVDENDYELPAGEVGELIVRATEPWTLNLGYWGMPEATALAWRNGWFHTGDSLYRSPEGDFFFVDRKKDALRRRGENVSSRELEEVVATFPGVAECAVIGVPHTEDEEEIKVVAVLSNGAEPDPAELIEYLQERVPSFMVPRYVEFVESLPHTEVTGRVQKVKLRERPLTETTWDRLAGRSR